jgi:hypothetical protein
MTPANGNIVNAPPDVRPIRQLGVRVEDELYHRMKIRAAQMGIRDWEAWEAAGWTWLKQAEEACDGG